MTFALTAEQLEIREAVARLCQRFGDDYWLKKDSEGGFPHEFHRAMAEAGWLGVRMPEEYGGSGLGISEAALVMQAVAQSGAGFSGASAVHMNIFGLHPVVVFGTDDQKRRFLPPLIAGKEKACFAVTEPDVGLDTTRLKTRAVRDGNGFQYILHGMNPERILIAAEAVGLGRAALARAARYAGERVVFGRPIGQNQGIQHPLAERWIELEAAELLVLRAAAVYDRGDDAGTLGAFANAAKYFAAEAGHRACETAVLTHGGMGYAREFHVERFFREIQIARIAPISGQLILSHIAERVLGLPKSY